MAFSPQCLLRTFEVRSPALALSDPRHQQGLPPGSRSQTLRGHRGALSHAASLPVHCQALAEHLVGVGLGAYCVQSPHLAVCWLRPQTGLGSCWT